METKTIAVDFDVHKKIEAERRGFDEPENAALRRLLGLPEPPADIAPAPKNGSIMQGISAILEGAWCGKGVELPIGTELRLDYPGVVVGGEIKNGRWHVGGETFDSPSSAACYVVSKVRGREMSVNGWLYWSVKRPTDSAWIPLDSLRNKSNIGRRQRS